MNSGRCPNQGIRGCLVPPRSLLGGGIRIQHVHVFVCRSREREPASLGDVLCHPCTSPKSVLGHRLETRKNILQVFLMDPEQFPILLYKDDVLTGHEVRTEEVIRVDRRSIESEKVGQGRTLPDGNPSLLTPPNPNDGLFMVCLEDSLPSCSRSAPTPRTASGIL